MQIAIIKDNAVETMGEHKELFPNVGFPGGVPTESWMAENSVMPVTQFRPYNGLTEKSTPVDPYIESGVVYLHKIETLDDSEKLLHRQQETIELQKTTERLETDYLQKATGWQTVM